MDCRWIVDEINPNGMGFPWISTHLLADENTVALAGWPGGPSSTFKAGP